MNTSNFQSHLEIQQLAVQSAQYAAQRLEPGMTEIEAVKIMREYLVAHGADTFFHYPFAWFGDRTCFKDFKQPLAFLDGPFSLSGFFPDIPHFGQQFLPSNKKLEKNMAVILDVAPSRQQVFADIGFSFFYGSATEDYLKGKNILLHIRNMIPQWINAGSTIHQLYHQVESALVEHHFANRHALYPLGVLGHKVGVLPAPLSLSRFNFKRGIRIMGFSPEALLFILKQERPFQTPTERTPFLRAGVHHPLSDGLWAVEPHLGTDDWGMKFEEILVVERGKAFWLNPNPPPINELSY